MTHVARDTCKERLINLISDNTQKRYTADEIYSRDLKDENFIFYLNRNLVDRIKIMKSGGMKNQYLGACLDYVRVGAMNACFWNFGGTKGLIGFIQDWMKTNDGNLAWSDEPLPAELALPFIEHKGCPRDEGHLETVIDGAGRTRCAHLDYKLIKPSFVSEHSSFDNLSMLPRFDIYQNEPIEPCPDDLDGVNPETWKEYLRRSELFVQEDPIQIRDYCYAIISEPKNMVMPLEKIFGRLNIASPMEMRYCEDRNSCKKEIIEGSACFGHYEPNSWVGFPFCGWTLAWYVQKWYEQVQNGQAPLFMKPSEQDSYNAFPNFQVMSSDD